MAAARKPSTGSAATSGVSAKPLLGGQSALVELVTTSAGVVVRKSPREFVDPQVAVRQADAEVLAARVAQAVGAPAPGVQHDPDDRAVVWVEYLDGLDQSEHAVKAAGIDNERAVRMGLLDTLTGNMDRMGNLGCGPDGQLIGFDHAEGWGPLAHAEIGLGDGQPYLREPDSPMCHFVAPREYGTDGPWAVEDPPITRAECDRIRARLQALRPEFDALNRSAWLDHSLDVLATIRANALDLEGA